MKSKVIKFGFIALLVLFVVNLVMDSIRREERESIPTLFVGTWTGSAAGDESASVLRITSHGVQLTVNGKVNACRAEKVVIFHEGMFLINTLFGEKRMAVICDKHSTDADQRGYNVDAPEDYRKRYYFSIPHSYKTDLRVIEVEETVYMPNQYSAGGGAHHLYLDHFTNAR